ncbi:hypothetical protein [Falsiroseomonas oryzae]|uniref:hypothetical protein n=1 Tax=Falsiroseomonas oryzae TaxID=2766473 RepID=UPI0022EA34BA|nr:hypothetical protein [Roseomonas sp. MO-31]
MILLNTWVPEDAANPHMEICHAFVYRWLIGRGRMLAHATSDPMTGPFNGQVMRPILWPNGGQPVRVAGVNRVSAGDIVGFFAANGDLVHSMVAETPTQWVGANNQGCFGTGTGRTTVPNVYGVRPPVLGWLNLNDNTFQTMGGPVTVVYRTP